MPTFTYTGTADFCEVDGRDFEPHEHVTFDQVADEKMIKLLRAHPDFAEERDPPAEEPQRAT